MAAVGHVSVFPGSTAGPDPLLVIAQFACDRAATALPHGSEMGLWALLWQAGQI